MNESQVKQLVMSGTLVNCTQAEYLYVRCYLQNFAGESLDNGQIIHAHIALSEVKRLDAKFKNHHVVCTGMASTCPCLVCESVRADDRQDRMDQGEEEK